MDNRRNPAEEESSEGMSWGKSSLWAAQRVLCLFLYVLHLFPEVFYQLITVVASVERIWERAYILFYSQLDCLDL